MSTDAELRDFALAAWRDLIDDEGVFETFESLLPTVRWRGVIPEELLADPAVQERMRTGDRRMLRDRLAEVLGGDIADATLEFLPPVAWDVLAQHGIPVSRLRP